MLDNLIPWVVMFLIYVIGGIFLYTKGRRQGRKEGYEQGYFDRAHLEDSHPHQPFPLTETPTKRDH